ncbi:MAG: FHA domain-containing protein [Saccharofermentanales bacterium]
MQYNVITKNVSSIDSIVYYQIDIIQKQPHLHILPVHVAAQERQALLEVDISGKTSWSEYLETHTFSRNEWICFLLKVAETISISAEYFLDPSCFELSLSSIYFHAGENPLDFKSIFLVYFPVAAAAVNDPLHSFCYDILQYISTLQTGDEPGIFTEDEQEKIAGITVETMADDIACLRGLLKCETHPERKNNILRNDVSLSVSKKIFEFFKIFRLLKSEKNLSHPESSRGFIMPGIILSSELILILLSFVIYRQKTYFTGRITPVILISVILLLCGILDIYLLYNKKSPLYLIHTDKSKSAHNDDFVTDSIFTSKEEKTVLLGKVNEASRIAMLCSGIPGTPEESMGLKAYILVEDFLIGRDSAKVDFKINSLSVGRVHARISRKENSFFIEDLGSKNGTFLDQRRLKKNDEYNLPDKCKIRFAEQEFYFVAN